MVYLRLVEAPPRRQRGGRRARHRGEHAEPGDAPGVREAAWLWQLLDEAKRLGMHLMTLDGVSQERLAEEVQSRIDIESLRPRLEGLLKELGVEDPIAWLESRS